MKPRILHFRLRWTDEETVCWKAASRVRSCTTLTNWDSPIIAGGKRCPKCEPIVEVLRQKLEQQAKDRAS